MTEAATLAISALDAVCRELDEALAEINRVHLILDADASQIVRNAKDGYPEGREDRVLSLEERIQALCLYAADWKRWCLEKEAENKRLNELLDANTVHSCGDNCQRPTCKRAMRNAIKRLASLVRDCMKENDESDPFRTEWEISAQKAMKEFKHFIQ